MKPFLIGTYEAKTRFFQCLKYQEHGAGYWHFPKKLEKDFFEQITSEHLMMSFVGGREILKWEMKIQGSRNEALDTAILNLFAIHASKVDIKSYVQYLENLKQPKKIVPLVYKKIKT
jgi:phage terminase large subunit GpA-like protein